VTSELSPPRDLAVGGTSPGGSEAIIAGLMGLASGSKLGPYEIVEPLGAGGMGEVYRARDSRLGRIVAIKVLPERLSQNVELRQRLEQEARTVSRLSHPISAPSDSTLMRLQATPEQLRSLQEKTEQYCVVMQTLVRPPRFETDWVNSR
jgi:serine/threonine protein kinase